MARTPTTRTAPMIITIKVKGADLAGALVVTEAGVGIVVVTGAGLTV